ncbi:hypothetical protein G6F64_015536 [Rhizopus arrhizus]|uniref:Uncharacterized protein n=1 Tax=Rhizopus oryzae TaxID=64495 RepID=A0A9P6WR41_RHIOR|nr:hypothetical protein G6F64_015536 [Rhizopus arrhizus]
MPQQAQAQRIGHVVFGVRAGLAQIEAAAQHAAERRVARQMDHVAVQGITVGVQRDVLAESNACVDRG